MLNIQISKFPLAGVTVDLQETDITVNEDVGSIQVCVAVKCGCVRRDVEVNLNVLDDTGQCKCICTVRLPSAVSVKIIIDNLGYST